MKYLLMLWLFIQDVRVTKISNFKECEKSLSTIISETQKFLEFFCMDGHTNSFVWGQEPANAQ